MPVLGLKRVTVSSERGLRDWLAINGDREGSVMVVTFTEGAGATFVSRDQVQDALGAYGWGAGRRYTLNRTLIGHVISKPRA